jgi:predicted flap endonuclease-1-like 5' DNA nuclease
MEGFLWLITQMALLLTAAAAVFLWLGWRWRGLDARHESQAFHARIDAETASARTAIEERDAAKSNDEMLRATQLKIESDLQEANDHRRNLERELIRVHDDLKIAKRDADQRAEDTATAKAALAPAKIEISRLSADLDHLRREKERFEKQRAEQLINPSPAAIEKTASDVVPIQPLPVSTETEKPKRLRKTPADPKAKVVKPSKPSLDAQATLARLETDLTAKQTLLSAVQQERDDWSRRVATLREKGKDPAGLGLAQKSLARAEVDVSVAKKAVDHLLHQQNALRHSLEQGATITHTDDLTRIKGIKAVLQEQLHALGIRTFQQIAAWTDDDVEAFSELLSFKDRAKRDQWVKQAQELMAA